MKDYHHAGADSGDWTQIITIYNGPLHIINNYNSTCVSNSKIQYTTL